MDLPEESDKFLDCDCFLENFSTVLDVFLDRFPGLLDETGVRLRPGSNDGRAEAPYLSSQPCSIRMLRVLGSDTGRRRGGIRWGRGCRRWDNPAPDNGDS